MISAISFFFSFLENKIKKIPMRASTELKDTGLRSFTKTESPLIPVRLRSHAVAVVPILAPMMTPTACVSFMIPEFTNPTTSTVVADDD